MMLSTGMARERALASWVTAPTCGVRTTLGRSLNGLFSGGKRLFEVDVEAGAGDLAAAQRLRPARPGRASPRGRC